MVRHRFDDLALHHPIRFVTCSFLVWKILIFVVGAVAPGIGYDTSASLLHYTSGSNSNTLPSSLPILLKFTRWDAIYYLQLSSRGHLYEQEWAFGKGLSTIISSIAKISTTKDNNTVEYLALIGIVVSHVSHYLAAVLMWKIAGLLYPNAHTYNLGASVLYILSPAGIFLSAPYSESVFAFLNILGLWLYLQGHSSSDHNATTHRNLQFVSSGLVLGLATMIRGNGVLSGIPFLWDALETALGLIRNKRQSPLDRGSITYLISIVVGGSLIAVGLAVPQLLGYLEYCSESSQQRLWCRQRLPLIYEFVQSHYWNVGFLRYWTLSNVPLFLLAIPCLSLMIKSATDLISTSSGARITVKQNSSDNKLHTLKQRLAVPQLLLALLAITNYHVQVITRLSSAYPWWYIWIAEQMNLSPRMKMVVYYFVLYALIQATLFASFLPPA